jgi:hypothetical protein
MKIFTPVGQSLRSAGYVIKDTLRAVKQHPEVATYPYLAALFTSITYPLISTTIFADWYRRAFAESGIFVPDKARAVIGLVGFLAFYSALVSAFFTCAVSISVIAKLENHPTPPFYGILRVIRHFFRVSRFAVFSVFFFLIGIFVQRRKLPGGWLGVLGSSFTLHMAQLAPSILTTRKKFGDTIRDSIDTLGKKWHEALVLKIGMYLVIFLLVVLPKLIQHGLFSSHTASSIGWVISIELGISSLVGFKVLNSIFTAVMYHQARSNKNT